MPADQALLALHFWWMLGRNDVVVTEKTPLLLIDLISLLFR
jgi:hypothetical protein